MNGDRYAGSNIHGVSRIMNTRRRSAWANGPLYSFFMQAFPAHRNIRGQFDVMRLARELNRSPEAVYMWLRGRALKPSVVIEIDKLVREPANLALLRAAGREPPTREEFEPFVYVV